MATAASLAGVSAHGLKWKHQIRLGHLSTQIGQGDLSEAQIGAIRDETSRRVRAFILGLVRSDMTYELENAADDMDMIDPNIEELRAAYTTLYDLFDFWRIVSV